MARQKVAPDDLPKVQQDALLERVVLSSVLSKHPQGPQILDKMTVEDFFHPTHRSLYKILLELREDHEPMEPVSVMNRAEHIEGLEGDNLFDWLREMRTEVLPSEDVLGATKKLRRLAMARQAHTLMHRATLAISGGESGIDEVLDNHLEQIGEILRQYEEFDEEGISYREAAKEAVDELIHREKIVKVFTGVKELDEMTGGFRPGELVIITAETGTGKTLLAQQTRANGCNRGLISLFCSGEMKAKHLLRRELSAAAGVPPELMRREEGLEQRHIHALFAAAQHQCEKCRILDGDLTFARIRRTARARKAKTNLHLVVIDYDELVEVPGKDENDQLRRLVRMSKSLGIELDCVVILISQLTKKGGREDEQEDNRPPNLSRLYGSGAKIKHASLVVYAERKWQEKLEGVETDANIWLLKNRDGRTGRIPAIFNIARLRFYDKQQPQTEPDPRQGTMYA